MRLMRTLSATVLVAVLVVGCDDSADPGNVSENDLVGVWNATQFLLSSTADPTVTVERISQDGWFTLTINANGTWSEAGVFPGNPPKTEGGSGTYVIQGSDLVLTEDNDTETFTWAFVLSGNTLTLNSADEPFDFDGDGVDEAGTLEIVLTRS